MPRPCGKLIVVVAQRSKGGQGKDSKEQESTGGYEDGNVFDLLAVILHQA